MIKKAKNKKPMALLRFIDRHMRLNGYAPTVVEMLEPIGVKSKSSVARYIDQLVEDGLLEKDHYLARSIKLTPKGVMAVREDKNLRRLTNEEADQLITVMFQCGAPAEAVGSFADGLMPVDRYIFNIRLSNWLARSVK